MSNINITFVDSAPPSAMPLPEVAIRLHPRDDVAIAKGHLPVGTRLLLDTEGVPTEVRVERLIPSGHKIALRDLDQGEPIRRYGQIIGFATQPIATGEHVHVHNLGVHEFERDYAFGVDVVPVTSTPQGERRTFLGYKRAGGRVGTRNYIVILSSVNCSAHTSQAIAREFTEEVLAAYPNVDGVIALTHLSGCGNRIGGEDYVLLQRTLAGMARHPNIGGYLMVGLGCEANQINALVENYDLMGRNGGEVRQAMPTLVIQELGGIRRTVEAGVAAIKELLPDVNQAQRTVQPISELMLALQCGGSDGWSGVTANPVVGLVADEIVRQGGTVVLAETPEIYGAEHLLTRR
ncbi:MAG: altronate dehydratase family protein, partial [Chloroflexota bacterium]|nr:altronate dehydratase family protein [Chloroflexota bacterium]